MLEEYVTTNRDSIIISIPKELLIFAVTHSPYTDRLIVDDNGYYDQSKIKVLDGDLLVTDIIISMTREREDGSSFLSDVFDKSFEYLMKYSYSDGIQIKG